MSSKKLTTEKKLELIRKISSIADKVTLAYIERLFSTIDNPEVNDEDRQKAFSEIDKVLRIAKQYSDRVLLAEGKTTSNIGVEGKGGLPFKFVINKHYPKGIGDKCEGETADCADDAD